MGEDTYVWSRGGGGILGERGGGSGTKEELGCVKDRLFCEKNREVSLGRMGRQQERDQGGAAVT
jgi:hypothetical protein